MTSVKYLPYLRRRRFGTRGPSQGFSPPAVARAYQLPTLTPKRAPVIGILELGGGYNSADLSTAFNTFGLPVPSVSNLSVLGSGNSPGNDADGEVALDMQNAGGIAEAMLPGTTARLVMVWCPNSDQGFVGGIKTLVAQGVDAISVSWGGPADQSASLISLMEPALAAAVRAGIPVFVASGDNDAGDGESAPMVDYPASSPNACGCGGTSLTVSGSSVSEVVWNDGRGDGTGGGFSTVFKAPAWQQSALPKGQTMRGVPDVAGVADPSTGWSVYLDGAWQVFGGTSAVAPLWAGIWSAFRASGVPAEDLRPLLYGSPGALNDILQGNNAGYSAGPGWDACTGLGTPNGPGLASLFGGTPPPPPPPPPPVSVGTLHVTRPFVPGFWTLFGKQGGRGTLTVGNVPAGDYPIYQVAVNAAVADPHWGLPGHPGLQLIIQLLQEILAGHPTLGGLPSEVQAHWGLPGHPGLQLLLNLLQQLLGGGSGVTQQEQPRLIPHTWQWVQNVIQLAQEVGIAASTVLALVAKDGPDAVRLIEQIVADLKAARLEKSSLVVHQQAA